MPNISQPFIKSCVAAAVIVCASQSTYAAECSAKSGANTVPLLELYTSEGCSSCPPADKWMSGINNDKVTPLAFHVDYWDYIGWKDKFSKAEYSDRQRKGAAFAGAGFVYTPQFVMNGRDFKGWDNSRLNTSVGRIIAKRAAEHLKPCVLELGGKAPLIVLEDADLDEAVKAAAFGAFMNQGKICMSTERIIVVDAVADEFTAKFAAKARSMPTGDPSEGATPLGAVVDDKSVAHVNALMSSLTTTPKS